MKSAEVGEAEWAPVAAVVLWMLGGRVVEREEGDVQTTNVTAEEATIESYWLRGEDMIGSRV